MKGIINITDDEFLVFKKLVYGLVGINLTEGKKNLVVSRLSGRIRELSLGSFSNYIGYLEKCNDCKNEITKIINKITTNETSFFREMHHFEFLAKQALPKLMTIKKGKPLRVWSAACSSGEEPYSIAITAKEYLSDKTVLKILATDANTEVLEMAQTGNYKLKDLKDKIPEKYLKKYFTVKGDEIFIKETIKSLVTFRTLNFLEKTYPIGEPLDIIFCRNVMIYFDKDTKLYLLNKFYELMSASAYLFIGHSENLYSLTDKFKLIGNTIYQKKA
jgi:chemotaxis protein methyltransferase CheR